MRQVKAVHITLSKMQDLLRNVSHMHHCYWLQTDIMSDALKSDIPYVQHALFIGIFKKNGSGGYKATTHMSQLACLIPVGSKIPCHLHCC